MKGKERKKGNGVNTFKRENRQKAHQIFYLNKEKEQLKDSSSERYTKREGKIRESSGVNEGETAPTKDGKHTLNLSTMIVRKEEAPQENYGKEGEEVSWGERWGIRRISVDKGVSPHGVKKKKLIMRQRKGGAEGEIPSNL